MCTTLQFKNINTIVKGNTLILSALRSDDTIVSTSTTFYSPLINTKELLKSIQDLIKSLDKQRIPPKTPQIT